MKLTDENINYIKQAFNKMKSKEDLLTLLNFVKVLMYGEKSHPLEMRQLNFHSKSIPGKSRYAKFSIKKKSGADRIIHAPNKGLKSIQRCLNLIFQVMTDVHPAANGFVPNKSIVDNARVHTNSLYVYNIDLKDFFPSIEAGRIWGRIQYAPFNLNKKNGREELANIIVWLCTESMEVERLDQNQEWKITKCNVLPQGAPTSPTLTNIICQQLDFYLSAVAKRFGLRYSRYADDISFSSMHNVFQKEGDFIKEIHRIIAAQGFHIKDSKTRLQKEGFRQEVTGLIVNTKANVPQRYIKQLRVWIYYWEKYGYEKAQVVFKQHYIGDKGHVKKGNPEMANVIAGKLEYLRMVKGSENDLYSRLRTRFDCLVETPIKQEDRQAYLNNVVEILLKKGLEEAMQNYKPQNE